MPLSVHCNFHQFGYMDLPDVLLGAAASKHGFGPTAPMTAMGDAANTLQQQQHLLNQLVQLNYLQSVGAVNAFQHRPAVSPLLSMNPILIAQQQQEALQKLQQSLNTPNIPNVSKQHGPWPPSNGPRANTESAIPNQRSGHRMGTGPISMTRPLSTAQDKWRPSFKMAMSAKQDPFSINPSPNKMDKVLPNPKEIKSEIDAEFEKLIEEKMRKKLKSKKRQKSKSKKSRKKRGDKSVTNSSTSSTTDSDDDSDSDSSSTSDDDTDDSDDSDDDDEDSDSDSSTTTSDSDDSDDNDDDEVVGDLANFKGNHKLTESKILKMSSAPMGGNAIGLVDDEDMKYPPIPGFGAATDSGMRDRRDVVDQPIKSPVQVHQVQFVKECRVQIERSLND